MTVRVLIIGAGGHGQVVADILLRRQELDHTVQPIGYLDDDPGLIDKVPVGLPVLGGIGMISRIPHEGVIVAVGDNATRKRLYEMLQQQREHLVVACHPSAIVASGACIGPGCMICARVVVNPGSVIGANVILNTGCIVEHHNQIGAHVHVGPGANLGGEVIIGEGALIGIGATVMPRRHVGEWSTIGAGACVTEHVRPGLTVVGVPTRVLQRS